MYHICILKFMLCHTLLRVFCLCVIIFLLRIYNVYITVSVLLQSHDIMGLYKLLSCAKNRLSEHQN